MALNRLWLTDLEVLENPCELSLERRQEISEGEARWPHPPLDETDTAYERMKHNIALLIADGANTLDGLPFSGVSGFPVEDDTSNIEVINPAQVVPKGNLKLLWWGAPHPNPSRRCVCCEISWS